MSTPTAANHSSLANQTTEEQSQTERIQLIWIVIVTILSSTIVITLGVSLGIKIYFERQSVPRQPEAYFNGLVMTNAVFIPITANCIPTDYKGDIFPVLWENYTTNVNKWKTITKKNNIGRMGIRTSNVQKLRFLVRMSFAIGEEKTKT